MCLALQSFLVGILTLCGIPLHFARFEVKNLDLPSCLEYSITPVIPSSFVCSSLLSPLHNSLLLHSLPLFSVFSAIPSLPTLPPSFFPSLLDYYVPFFLTESLAHFSLPLLSCLAFILHPSIHPSIFLLFLSFAWSC